MDALLANRAGKGSRVLVADDDPQVRAAFADLLRACGCEVDAVRNGAEAIRAAFENRYDVIFMDYQMPDVDGCQATRAIRQREVVTGTHVTVIAFSALCDQHKFLASGMDGYLPKPPSRKEIVDILVRWVASKRVQRSVAGALTCSTEADNGVGMENLQS